ncbi:MFS transporter [Kitasatospora aburaviensis]
MRGQSATDVGLLGIPQALATGITMQIAGRLTDRIAAGRIVLTGAAVATTGFLAFTVQVAAGTPYWQLIAALVLMGTGVGMTIMPTIAAATRGVAPADVPAATTLVTIVQQVAGSTGTALMSVLLTGALAGHLPDGEAWPPCTAWTPPPAPRSPPASPPPSGTPTGGPSRCSPWPSCRPCCCPAGVPSHAKCAPPDETSPNPHRAAPTPYADSGTGGGRCRRPSRHREADGGRVPRSRRCSRVVAPGTGPVRAGE